jgi:hypothetical protein
MSPWLFQKRSTALSISRSGRARFARQTRRGKAQQHEQDFVCRNCTMYVPCDPAIAGVRNRNHCPYCLWSRHLDARVAGDRRSACRALMRPVGLTTKHSRNKYAGERDGELMVVHECTVCAKLVLNRVAADDSPGLILGLLHAGAEFALRAGPEADVATVLTARDEALVRRRLFGRVAA